MSPRPSTAWLRLAGLVLAIDAIVLLLFTGSVLWAQLFFATISLTPEGLFLVALTGAAAVAATVAASRALRGRVPARLPTLAVAGVLAAAALLILADGGSDQRAALVFAVGVAAAQALVLVAVLRTPAQPTFAGREVGR